MHSSGGRKEHPKCSQTQTLSKWPCSHSATPGSCSIHRPQRLFVPNRPLSQASPPPKERQSSCGTELAMPPTKLGKCSMNVPGVTVWNLDAYIYIYRLCRKLQPCPASHKRFDHPTVLHLLGLLLATPSDATLGTNCGTGTCLTKEPNPEPMPTTRAGVGVEGGFRIPHPPTE